MPNFDIIKENKPKLTFRVKSIIDTFDLQMDNLKEQFKGCIDLTNDWNIGLIVGKSGTGKTTIARQLFSDIIVESFDYSSESVIDDMPKGKTVSDISKAFNSVGFSSPPSWLKPYSVLSNGEKMRCDLARAILSDKDCFAFDEFTSVVDRNVAQIGSFAMQKAIRKTEKKFIAITCHHDVEEWLMPDWVFNTDNMAFYHFDKEQKKNKPEIKIDIYETKRKDESWRMFSKYHYLNHSFNKAARCFLVYCNDHLCAMCAVLPFPHPKKKGYWKEHRSVVFPDYQGIGIGHSMSSAIGDILKREGKGFISTSSNPAFINSRKRDDRWIVTRCGRTSTGSGKIQNKNKKGSTSSNRITYSFEYIGLK